MPEEKTRKALSVCKIGACEPFCGLELEVSGDKIVGLKPDRAHPISEGYICVKGRNLLGYQNSKDRLLHPLKRSDGGWERLDWKTTTREIGTRLRDIASRHGPRAIATYWGNAADSLGITIANTFCHAFGSPNSYNVLSLEYSDRGVVAEELYGNENLILQPDVTGAKYAILLGTNPVVTQGLTLLQRRPHIGRDLKTAQAAGCKLVVVDPRFSETARMADLHLPIRPGTDLFLLLAMIRTIVTEDLVDADFIAAHTSGFEVWLERCVDWTPEWAEAITGLEADTIRTVAREFASADGAFLSSRVGVQTSHNSVLTEWALASLTAMTGNIDRPGGLYYNPGVIDTPKLIEKFTRRRNHSPSRIGNFPPVFGGLPCSVLPDEILTEGEGQVRALVVIAGNPVISFPDTAKIERALRELELLVVVDIFLNDTATFADYVLPAATAYERESWHFLVDAFNQYPFAELRPKVVDPPGECRGEWEIFKDISRAARVPFLNNPLFDKLARFLDFVGIGFSPSLLNRYLLFGKTPSYRTLKRSPRGARGRPFAFGSFFSRGIRTADGKIHLAPERFFDELNAALQRPPRVREDFPYILISGARRHESYNSWTHNIPHLAEKLRGNWAIVNEEDARDIGLGTGDRIRIRSESGQIEIEARTSKKISRGVIAVHQHWGHVYGSGMTSAEKYPGVNVNHLHSSEDRDALCGMPVFNGRPVSIEILQSGA